MKKQLTLISSFAIVIMLIYSCEKQCDDISGNTPPDVIIVEGRFTDNPEFSYIKLSKPVSMQGETPSMLSGAEVEVRSNTDTFHFTESYQNKGTYYTSDAGEAGKGYNLHIRYNNQIFYAHDTMIQLVEGISLAYVKIQETNMFRLLWLYPWYTQTEPYQYEINILRPSADSSRLYFYTLSSVDLSSIFRPAFEQVSFPSGTIILAKKMSISPAYERFLRSLLIETQWSGGFFDTQKANPETNLSTGATGFFSASCVTTDSILVK